MSNSKSFKWIMLSLVLLILTYLWITRAEGELVYAMSATLILLSRFVDRPSNDISVIDFILTFAMGFYVAFIGTTYLAMAFLLISFLFLAKTRKKSFSFSLMIIAAMMGLGISAALLDFMPLNLLEIPIEWIILSACIFSSSPKSRLSLLPIGTLFLVDLNVVTSGAKSKEIIVASLVWCLIEAAGQSLKRIALACAFLATLTATHHVWTLLALLLLFVPENEYIKNKQLLKASLALSVMSSLSVATSPLFILTLSLILLLSLYRHRDHVIGDIC